MSPGRRREFLAHDEAAREALARIALARGGVFAQADLAAAGVDRATFRRLTRSGSIRRLRYGVYADRAVIDAALATAEDEHLLRAAAALRPLRRSAALTQVSALVAYGVAVPRSSLVRVHIWRPEDVDQRGGFQAVACSSDRGLPEIPAELAPRQLHGMSIVHPAVAAVHAACRFEPGWGLVACDAVLAAGQASRAELEAARDLLVAFRGHARAADAVRWARAGAESPLESLSRSAFLLRGIPEPRLQVSFSDVDGFIGRVDMLLHEWGVIGEADGLAKYSQREDLVAEKRREDRLRELGYEVVRWTWDDILQRPEHVVARLHAARSRRARRPAA